MTDECHEEVADTEGHAQPCNRPAVGWRVDPEENRPYPVCVTHHRWPYADEWVALRGQVEQHKAALNVALAHASGFKAPETREAELTGARRVLDTELGEVLPHG